MLRKGLVAIGLLMLLAGCSAPEPEIIDNGKPAQLTVLVFFDENHNKVRDEGERGVVNEVSVVQGNVCPTGKPREERMIQETGPDGLALFSNLAPGKYCISYLGTRVTTTPVTGWAYLDSEEESEVHFGVLVDED